MIVQYWFQSIYLVQLTLHVQTLASITGPPGRNSTSGLRTLLVSHNYASVSAIVIGKPQTGELKASFQETNFLLCSLSSPARETFGTPARKPKLKNKKL